MDIIKKYWGNRRMENILEVIKKQVELFNNESSKFMIDILDVNDIHTHPDYKCDYRLIDKSRYTCAVPIIFYEKISGNVMVISTIIIYARKDFLKVEFGCFQKENNIIERVSLDRLNEAVGDYAVTIGYTEFTQNLKMKVSFTKFFIRMAKLIMECDDTFFFVECTGLENLNQEIMDGKKIIESASFNSNNLGVTIKNGVGIDKFGKLMKLKKGHNVYNIYTLGSVYSNKQLTYNL